MKTMPKPIEDVPACRGRDRQRALAHVEDDDPGEPEQHEAEHDGLEPDRVRGVFAAARLGALGLGTGFGTGHAGDSSRIGCGRRRARGSAETPRIVAMSRAAVSSDAGAPRRVGDARASRVVGVLGELLITGRGARAAVPRLAALVQRLDRRPASSRTTAVRSSRIDRCGTRADAAARRARARPTIRRSRTAPDANASVRDHDRAALRRRLPPADRRGHRHATCSTARLGVGHYPGTQMPGEVGNFAVAAHRTAYGGGLHADQRAAASATPSTSRRRTAGTRTASATSSTCTPDGGRGARARAAAAGVAPTDRYHHADQLQPDVLDGGAHHRLRRVRVVHPRADRRRPTRSRVDRRRWPADVRSTVAGASRARGGCASSSCWCSLAAVVVALVLWVFPWVDQFVDPQEVDGGAQ